MRPLIRAAELIARVDPAHTTISDLVLRGRLGPDAHRFLAGMTALIAAPHTSSQASFVELWTVLELMARARADHGYKF